MNPSRFALVSVLCLGVLLSGCDALSGLGTDNAPLPAPLKPVSSNYTAKTLWVTQANQGVAKDYLLLGPVATADHVWSADAKGNVTCLDAHSGRMLWSTATQLPITSGPTVGEGIVVVGTADAHVLALNAATGQIVWRVKISNQLLAPPQIGQGRVIINTLSGKLSALTASTGQLLWTYEHSAPTLVLRGGGLPQIVDNKVIAGFADGKLATFDLANGHLLWQTTIAMPQGASQVQQMVDIVAAPLIADGTIYVVTYQGNIAALRLEDGEIKWTQAISSYTGIALAAERLIATDTAGNVWAFSRSDGHRVWQQTALLNRRLTAPRLVDNTIVVGDGMGYIHWLALADGRLLTRTLLSENKGILAPPAVVGQTAYVLTQNGLIAAETLTAS